MDWYGMSCARPCALLRGPAFLMPLYHALKILSPEDVIERTGILINPQIANNAGNNSNDSNSNNTYHVNSVCIYMYIYMSISG